MPALMRTAVEAAREAEAAVERAPGALVADLADEDQRHRAVVGLGHRDGAVAGDVVDEDHVPARPQHRALLEVMQQAREVLLLVERRNHEDLHQYAPRRPRTTGSVWKR